MKGQGLPDHQRLSQRLTGKVAIVTGAGGGIGAETARLLAAQGACVVAADVIPESAMEVARQIVSAGGQCIAVTVDIACEDQVSAMVATSIEAFGRIDILHNNAAYINMAHMLQDGAVTEIDVDHWDRTMAVNLRGPMLCCKHVIPHMIEGGGGSIVNTGSGKGVQGDLAQTAYGTSKAALIGFTRYVAAQYGKQGIRANVLVVGVILKGAELNGSGISASRQAQLARYGEHHLTTHLGTPRHVADAVAFLASDESAFITGTAIPVDGGFTSHAPTLADGRQNIGR